MYRRELPDWKSEYLDPELETMSREEIEKLQVERLKATVAHCMNNPVYKKRLEEAGVTPESITKVSDIRRIPFTTKQDLRENYPFGLASVPLTECVRLHSSSGTTGNPTVILHTQKDLDEWANQVARNLWMVGLRPSDVFQNSSGYGMFTGGLGFQYGAERLGMLTIPAAAGNSLRQIKFMKDFGTTALHAVPSYVTRLYEVMQETGVDPRKDTKLKVLAIGAEPHSEEQRKRIEQMLGVKAYNSFGMSEMCGPGVGFECKEQNGLHFWEDYYIVEIVNPETLEPVPDGEIGELVLTSINREAMPLLRYRTRDLTRVLGRTCKCGRNHVRIDRMKGRSDDMMVLRGVNIFPIQIEKILMQYKELASNYLITLTTDENNDNMTVEVELEDQFIDDYPLLAKLQKDVTRALKDEILLTPIVKLVPKGSLPVSEGKAVRVVDKRTVYQ
jgi:phenylacetate-CoA ligase